MAHPGTSNQPQKAVPHHVAVIMDGNGRWARERGLSRLQGHRAGTENIRRVISNFANHGVRYLTLYAFSIENWRRPRAEVRGLLRLLGEVIDREVHNLHREGVKLNHLGTLDGLSTRLQKRILAAVDLTKTNTGITLNLAFNYGGRQEILMAMNKLLAQATPPESVDETLFSQTLYTADVPDPDLIIRTAGEHRMSNFLLWQSAYSEYYSTPTCWPDFNEAAIEDALQAYSQRQRRFGGLQEQQ
ncbi:MAG: polyprenyl diphosphate synthase [Dehalococcoidia bacterium]|nr:polyprenyl diphosphate synthase [Dehalococcoidia bacterium]